MEEENHNEIFDRLKRELAALPPLSDPWKNKLQEIKAFEASDNAQISPPFKKKPRTAGRRRRNRRKTRRSRK